MLCWQALAPVSANYSVFLEIVGPDGQGYGRLETYPGRGNYATSLWPVRTPFCDEYSIGVRKDIPAPSVAQVRISLLNGVQGQPLVVQAAKGDTRGHEVWIPVRVEPIDALSSPAQPVEYFFGDGVVLRGYDLLPLADGKPGVRVRLYWEARQDLHEDYVVFVHLRDTPDHAYSQADSQPRNNWYPTSWWRAGDAVLDDHTLAFPSKNVTPPLSLYVGLVQLDSGERIQAFDARGQPLDNREIVLATNLVFP
jgi:hypothetical protein